MNLYQKLIEVRKVVPYLKKESQGHQYNYTGSSQVLAAVRMKLDELGLLLIPQVISSKVSQETVEWTDNKGNPKKTTTYFTELTMNMTWVNAENPEETISVPWYAQGIDTAGEKGVGKALTYAEKYFMLKQFNIATDKDDPDAFQAKMEEKARAVPTRIISEIKTEWSKRGFKLNQLDAQAEKLFGCKLSGLTEEQAQSFLDRLTGKQEPA